MYVMPHKPAILSKWIIYGAFAIGLLTAIAIRALIVINHINPELMRPVWYFAVIGNFIFFYYRYMITQKRRNAIDEFKLIEKVEAGQCLMGEDREVLLYLLHSLKKSLENYNYLIIFIFSLIAIAIDLGLTYFGM